MSLYWQWSRVVRLVKCIIITSTPLWGSLVFWRIFGTAQQCVCPGNVPGVASFLSKWIDPSFLEFAVLLLYVSVNWSDLPRVHCSVTLWVKILRAFQSPLFCHIWMRGSRLLLSDLSCAPYGQKLRSRVRISLMWYWAAVLPNILDLVYTTKLQTPLDF